MYEWEEKEKSHPLYPKQDETYQRISIYPPKECDICAKVDFEVEWYEVVKTETQSLWITPGTRFTIKTQMKKLCKRCHTLETNTDFGAFG
jgi:RNA polymerase subunit RPABC4/transcription elongation factor Spt4